MLAASVSGEVTGFSAMLFVPYRRVAIPSINCLSS